MVKKMVIEKLIIKEGITTSIDSFSENFNLITSYNENSVGKSTYCRLIFFSLGYTIPATEGINFEKLETSLYVENNKKHFIINRVGKSLFLETDSFNKIYSLPDEHMSFIAYLFGVDNLRIASNLLGLMYIDQEKGWTLLNRGKVIGNNRFSVDELVAALNNIDCEDLFQERETLEKEIQKYSSFLQMNSIKTEYYENNNNLEVTSIDDDIKRKISSLHLSKEHIKYNIKEIDSVLMQDKNFFEYIESMNLYIRTPYGLIPVKKDNIENSCNIEYLKAEKTLLLNQLSRLDKELSKLQRDLITINNGTPLYGSNSVVDTERNINNALSNININVEVIEQLIKETKAERENINSSIRIKTRANNEFISKIYSLLIDYSQKLGIADYISNNIDYIFTKDLKGKTGARFQKLIIAFKVAIIKTVEEYIGTKLFLVIDSPKSKELDDNNTRQIMTFLKEELPDNQVIIASIYSENELFIDFEKKHVFINRAVEQRE